MSTLRSYVLPILQGIVLWIVGAVLLWSIFYGAVRLVEGYTLN